MKQLISSPFLFGLVSLFDISGSIAKERLLEIKSKSIGQAMASDWDAVKKDMFVAYQKEKGSLNESHK